jgi:hypothetical protein
MPEGNTWIFYIEESDAAVLNGTSIKEGGITPKPSFLVIIVFFSVQCRSECEKHISIWERCIHEAGTNVETEKALSSARQDVVS